MMGCMSVKGSDEPPACVVAPGGSGEGAGMSQGEGLDGLRAAPRGVGSDASGRHPARRPGGNGLAMPPYVSQWGDMACNVAAIERGEDPAGVFDWRTQGYPNVGAYRLWSRSTCGLACLEEALLARSPEGIRPFANKWELIRRAIDQGVFRVEGDPASDRFATDGLIYRPFVEWVARDFGLAAVSRPDLPIDEVADLVGGGAWLAMLSVSYEIRTPDVEPTHVGGHLVLAFDALDDAGGAGTPGAEAAGPAVDAALEGAPGASGHGCRLVFHNSSGLAPTPDRPDRPNSAVAVTLPLERFGAFYAGRGVLIRRG